MEVIDVVNHFLDVHGNAAGTMTVGLAHQNFEGMGHGVVASDEGRRERTEFDDEPESFDRPDRREDVRSRVSLDERLDGELHT